MPSLPNAVEVFRNRVGDCNEFTVLYVALARALGLPARAIAGLVYLDGHFYYHAWPEVYAGRWIMVDPVFGQVPADGADSGAPGAITAAALLRSRAGSRPPRVGIILGSGLAAAVDPNWMVFLHPIVCWLDDLVRSRDYVRRDGTPVKPAG